MKSLKFVRIAALLLALLMAFSMTVGLVACGETPDDGKDRTDAGKDTSGTADAGKDTDKGAADTTWPSTRYPQPENCEIVSVVENYILGTVITVKWADKDAYDAYVQILIDMGEEKISGVDTEEASTFGSYNITVGYSSAEGLNSTITIY